MIILTLFLGHQNPGPGNNILVYVPARNPEDKAVHKKMFYKGLHKEKYRRHQSCGMVTSPTGRDMESCQNMRIKELPSENNDKNEKRMREMYRHHGFY